METNRLNGRPLAATLAIALLPCLTSLRLAAQDDHEFQSFPSLLSEGFPGPSEEPGKDPTIEPVDGEGGFANVAPQLGPEIGPGGQMWNVSPSYRTRYKYAIDYQAGPNQLQGNNWFTSIPKASYDGGAFSPVRVRFDATTFRVYTTSDGTTWWGRYANKYSKIKKFGPDLKLYDTDGRTYLFPATYDFRCTAIEWVGGARTTIEYGSSIVVYQQTTGDAGTEVRKLTYILDGDRIDRIDIAEKDGVAWPIYRKIDFTYHENVTGAVESTSGDLIGIKEETLLSPTNTWLERKWVFKYYTGAYNPSTNPGYPFQIKAVLSPQSVHDWEIAPANQGIIIYTQNTSQLATHVDRVYEYEPDKRLDKLELKSGCGCGSGEGVYTYAWDIYGSEPGDLNSWYRRATITLPDPDGPTGSQVSASRLIDYNKYGQKLNEVTQEVATNPSSRRWIMTWVRDTVGRLTESYSVKACWYYTDGTHIVTLYSTGGRRWKFSYTETPSGADTVVETVVRLQDPMYSQYIYYQRKASHRLKVSGDRRRFRLDSSTEYPNLVYSDSGGVTTSFTYTYHPTDTLAVMTRTRTMPVIVTGENGSGQAETSMEYFELDGLNTWSKDADDYVNYTRYDPNRRTVIKRVININTQSPPSASPPIPAPPSGFNTLNGINLVTDYEYDRLMRLTKEILPAFNAWTGTSVAWVNTTRQRYYTKLSGGELVTIEYPHLDTAYFDVALSLLVHDFDGHVVTSASGVLTTQNADPSDDVLVNYSTLSAAFQGTLVRRTDFTFQGDKLRKEEVWSDVDSVSAPKYTTEHSYDAAGRKVTTKVYDASQPPVELARTISRWTYDNLGRAKKTELGTDAGTPGDMTTIDEVFYDDEEDGPSNVGEGNVTHIKRYTSYLGGSRNTSMTYDYRNRVVETLEPGNVKETQSYTNRNQVASVMRYDISSGSVLMARSENLYDAWGQLYETKTFGVVSGADNGYYASVKTWRNGRGLVVKTKSQGNVLQKTQYDGAGRMTNQAVSYDTAETSYLDALNLAGDTVMQETRYVLDATGGVELVGLYERWHDGQNTGPLKAVDPGRNARAQYVGSWYDMLHRKTHEVAYGTNGGGDMTARPSGAGYPPSASGVTQDDQEWLTTKYSYTVKSEILELTDPINRKTRTEYNDAGRLTKRIENYSGSPPGTDSDRTVEYAYNAKGQLWRITAKATMADQVTEYLYGVQRGVDNSLVSSNELLKGINYPYAWSGQPSTNPVDQERFGYNAHGETVWRKDQAGNEHTLEYDDRGRLTHDRVTVLLPASGIDGAIRRISRIYDALDRPVKITSWDNHVVGSGMRKNEVQYEYDRYSTVSKIYQEWAGAVNTGTSRKVQFAYSFPTNGTTPLRRTSTTYPSGTVITETYNAGTDDILSRSSGRKLNGNWLFQEKCLGLGRLVERQYGSLGILWTLLGTDLDNNDNYVGLDRFGRIDDLNVKQGATEINHYQYLYNFLSQILRREDLVGIVGTSQEFDETAAYDNLGRLTDHQRGQYYPGTPPAMNPLRLHECWTLDRSGNCTDYYSGASAPCGATWDAAFNHSNEYSVWSPAFPITYNDAGDLTEKGEHRTFTYDAWNRLVAVTDVPLQMWVSRFEYNGLNQKIKRTNSASSLPDVYYYYNDEWQVIDDIQVGSGALYNYYVWGTQYIDDLVVRGPSNIEYQVQDAQHNVVTRLNYDGTVYRRYIYDAYGMPKQLMPGWTEYYPLSEDLHLLTGRLYYKDIARYDYRMRSYDPELHRFPSSDPLGLWSNPSDFGNASLFVNNDPVNRIDPLGLYGGIQDVYAAAQVGIMTGNDCEREWWSMYLRVRTGEWQLTMPLCWGLPAGVKITNRGLAGTDPNLFGAAAEAAIVAALGSLGGQGNAAGDGNQEYGPSATHCDILVGRNPGLIDHKWIEGPGFAYGFWPNGVAGLDPKNPEPYKGQYKERDLWAVKLRVKWYLESGVIDSKLYAGAKTGTPCKSALCQDIYSCIDSMAAWWHLYMPWSVCVSDCHRFVEQVLNNCCLEVSFKLR